MTAFQDCVADARAAIIEAAEYEADFLNGMSHGRVEAWMGGAIHEAVDGAVPIYDGDVMTVAADPRVWSQDVDDFGTPRDLIHAAQWAVYKAIEEALYADDSILTEIMEIADREIASA